MITNFKIFENFENVEVGDYVIFQYKYNDNVDKRLIDFFNSNVGKLHRKRDNIYETLYKRRKGNEKNCIYSLDNNFMIFHSKSKKEAEEYLKHILISKKYNI